MGAVYPLPERIDSGSAAEFERDLSAAAGGRNDGGMILDAAALRFISSAGLRVILRLKNADPGLSVINVCPDVYEIFEMTGFTEMIRIEKAYRSISVEGCEVIGEGYKGRVYRIGPDTIVKVYKASDDETLAAIRHEREVARLALILGVPTAISYDVVRVGGSFGSVFELLDARSFAKILSEDPGRIDWCVEETVKLIKKVHSIAVPAGKLPSAKQACLEHVRGIRGVIPDGSLEKLESMVLDIPESDKMIHGDYHTKNIMLAGDEVMLIDMDTLSVGDPVFELAQMYNSYVGFSENDPGVVFDFQGYPHTVAREFWRKSLESYLAPADPLQTAEAEDKIRCVAYASLIDWFGSSGDRETLDLWIRHLTELLGRVNDLRL